MLNKRQLTVVFVKVAALEGNTRREWLQEPFAGTNSLRGNQRKSFHGDQNFFPANVKSRCTRGEYSQEWLLLMVARTYFLRVNYKNLFAGTKFVPCECSREFKLRQKNVCFLRVNCTWEYSLPPFPTNIPLVCADL